MRAGQPLPLPTQAGRCSTLTPTTLPAYSQPAKPSRHGSFKVEYGGISLRYNRWVKQLRRLESLMHASANLHTGIAKSVHMAREWRAVLQATGFPSGFRQWWLIQHRGKEGLVTVLPHDVPPFDVLVQLFCTFENHVNQLQQQLVTSFRAKAMSNRQQNPNQVYRDVHKPRVSPVQILDHSVNCSIIEVDEDDLSVVISPPASFDVSRPVYTEAGSMSILHAEEDKLWLEFVDGPSNRKRPTTGPCAVLLHRLEQIGWFWDHGFHDQSGDSVDLWDCCIQELGTRVRDAWQQMVMTQLEQRKTFEGASSMHVGFTMRTPQGDPSQSKLLRQALSGTSFTADRLRHRTEASSCVCQYCGQPDSPFHRHVECPHFQDVRSLSPSQIHELRTMPIIAGSHGWLPCPSTLPAFRRYLQQLPDTTNVFCIPAELPDHLDLFTDGSCLHNSDSVLRLASWGVACALYDGDDDHRVIASGLLHGQHQTVTRAELAGVLSALNFVLVVKRPFYLWIDNEYVLKKIRQMATSDTWFCKKTSPNHDLLQQVFDKLQRVRMSFRGAYKVVSHQHHCNLTPLERWACAGNDVADRAAEQAFSFDPHLRHLHAQLVGETHQLDSLRQALHASIIAIGEKVVQGAKPLLPSEPDDETPEPTVATNAPGQPLAFQSWSLPSELPGSARRYNIADWGVIQPWVSGLQEGAQIMMWSWHQLYADFQLHHPGVGPWFHLAKQRWESGGTMPTVPFTTRSRWLSQFLQGVARVLDIQIPWCKAHPASCVLSFWTNCVKVRVDRQRQTAVDEWLSSQKVIYRCSKDLHVLP
eukprot:Skav220294  [mRNA]  locus=scaffold2356:24733:28644:- [translate_table: standard]